MTNFFPSRHFPAARIFRFRRVFLFSLGLGLAGVFAPVQAGPSGAESEPVDIFSRMSAVERERTGIDSLTARQRAALLEWLQQHLRAGEGATAASQPNRATAEFTTEAGSRASSSTESVAASEAAMEAEVQRRVAQKLAQEKAARAGRENKSLRTPVQARIQGTFKGWRGATEFTFDNGQVWKQVDGETYYIRRMQDPEVELVPMALGSWGLRIKATGRTVKVRRIR